MKTSIISANSQPKSASGALAVALRESSVTQLQSLKLSQHKGPCMHGFF